LEFAPQIVAKLREKARRYAELTTQLSDPEIAGDHVRYTGLLREQGLLESANRLAARMSELIERRSQAQEMIADDTGADPEMLELVREELASLKELEGDLDREIKTVLVSDPQWDRNKIIVEIRAGAGGAESALFSADLHRMYIRYAESQGWKVEPMDASASDLGGFKEVIFGIKGQDVFRKLKFESGVHRVQRVPATETQGRVHTSTVTVAVLPEAEAVDIEIKPDDLEINVCRASGPGGQGVNTTDSAVQIQHKPSGMIVRCMDGRSQQKNKEQAMKVLRSRLLEQKIAEEHAKYAAQRKSQIGTGERNERIRTYNFSQNRVTDHRIDLTLYNLPTFIVGEIEEVVSALLANDLKERLAALE